VLSQTDSLLLSPEEVTRLQQTETVHHSRVGRMWSDLAPAEWTDDDHAP
jgi:hypothetical protein